MAGNQANFEQLRHQNYSGEFRTIPLLIDTEGGVNDTTNTLLHAADIIAANVDEEGETIKNIVDRVGQILTNPQESEGVIIEGKDGGGSVIIDFQLTKVVIPSTGTFMVPTQHTFDMLYQWSQYSKS